MVVSFGFLGAQASGQVRRLQGRRAGPRAGAQASGRERRFQGRQTGRFLWPVCVGMHLLLVRSSSAG